MIQTAKNKQTIRAKIVNDTLAGQKLVAHQPLKWGHWPTVDQPLLVDGMAGRFAFIAPFPCGPRDSVLVLRWNDRQKPQAPRFFVDWSVISLAPPPAKRTTTRAKPASGEQHNTPVQS